MLLTNNLGNVFKNARKAKGMTQFQVAEMASIDEKHYGRIERSECPNLTLSTFIQICKALDIKTEKKLYEVLKELY